MELENQYFLKLFMLTKVYKIEVKIQPNGVKTMVEIKSFLWLVWETGLPMFVIGIILMRLWNIYTEKPKIIVVPQNVAHRLVIPNVELIRENRRMAHLIPVLEKKLKFYKQEAERWIPRSQMIEDANLITLQEAQGWTG